MRTPTDGTADRRGLWTRARAYIPILLVVACNLPGLRNVDDRPIERDFDTPAILEAIREDTSVRGLAGWFARDWPLGNGFYRPVVAISLAGDNAIYGDNARGYRLTSWLIALGCSLGMYWLLACLSGSHVFAGCAAAMFGLRQSGVLVRLSDIVQFAWAAAILVGIAGLYFLRGRESKGNRHMRDCVIAAAATFVLVESDWRSNSIVVQWIAARTALLGAFFCVLALGGFVKVLRTGRRGWIWVTMATGCLALCSYEQSVMLPFAALALWLWHAPLERKAAMTTLGALGLMLVLYVAVRLWAVGDEVTTYHMIQAKTSLRGPVRALADYALPPTSCIRGNWQRLATSGPWFGLDQVFWVNLALIAGWLLAYVRLCRTAWRPTVALWLVKALTFLPMAFLHPFPHYVYLPETVSCALGIAALWPGGLSRREESV